MITNRAMSNYSKKCLIIVGSGRSGTSWLAENLAKTFRYRLLFEPDHEFQIPRGAVLTDRLLDASLPIAEVDAYLGKLFKNRIDSDWIAQNSNRKYKMHLWPFLAKKHIIKFVRASLGGRYMNERYGIPVVHIIRNPYDVIFSQQRVKFPWLYDLNRFRNQETLVELIKDSYNFDITKELNSEVEVLALRWVIENNLVLEDLGGYTDNSLLVKYEDLNGNLDKYLEICHRFNLEYPKDVAKRFKEPSSKTHPNSHVNKGAKSKGKLSTEDSSAVSRILEQFRTESYPIV